MVIGRSVIVSFITPNGNIDILAKVDTGAYSSSIDSSLFNDLNIEQPSIKTSTVKNVHGEFNRDVYLINFNIKDKNIDSELNVFDRSNMKYKMILGRKDIKKIKAVVDIKLKDKL